MPKVPWRRGGLPALIVVAAIGIRIWWANPFATSPPTNDPDGYLQLARELGDGVRPWRWTLNAVRWIEFFKAPLYQVALSGMTANPTVFPLPQSALLAHALLGGLTALALYFLGVSLHNARAGLLAAAAYALWIPNVLVTATFWQEHLFIPLLVLGLALLARAHERQQRLRYWVAAGAVFGLCALTRSAVAYFVPIAAVYYVAIMPKTRAVFTQAGGLVGGFVVTVLPYVIFISMALGRFMPIEDSGAVMLRRSSPPNPNVTITQFMKDPNHGTTGLETVRYLVAGFAADPVGFTLRHADYIRLLLKPAGGSLLLHLDTAGPSAAARWKSAVHLGIDLPFIGAAVLCPFGVALSRNRVVSALLALFIAQYLALLALTVWAGTRYRSPVEPLLIALAAVVFAGGWRSAGRWALAGATAAALVVALVIGQSLGSTLQAKPNYGVGSWEPAAEAETTFHGRAGANVIVTTSTLTFTLQAPPAGPSGNPITVSVHIAGRLVDILRMTAGETKQVRYRLEAPGVHYVEWSATAADGRPVTMRLTLP